MSLVMHIDGGARGNPGPAGAGVVIQSGAGKPLHEAGYFLGHCTNNAAEYQALILGLNRALSLQDGSLMVYSDSELLVQQITGQYRVKSPNLKGYVQEAQRLLLKFDDWSIQHVRREKNRRADQLANMAMDRKRDCVVINADAGRKRAPSTGQGSAPANEDSQAGPPPRLPEDEDHAIRVVVSERPFEAICRARDCMPAEFILKSAFPADTCLHAAHALLPTVLAMNNTDPKEFAALPTVTVRCVKPDCGATFLLSPVKSPNGAPKPRSGHE